MIKRIVEGQCIPRFYAVAWRDYVKFETICLPIGINILAKIARGAWVYIKCSGRWNFWFEKQILKLTIEIRERERKAAQKDMYNIASNIAEKIYQERFVKDFNNRIDALLKSGFGKSEN